MAVTIEQIHMVFQLQIFTQLLSFLNIHMIWSLGLVIYNKLQAMFRIINLILICLLIVFTKY